MGIVNLLKGLMVGDSDDKGPLSDAASQFKTRRFHVRYPIRESDLMNVSCQGRGKFRVLDVSYRGCLLESLGGSSLDGVQVPSAMMIEVFGRRIPIQVLDIQKRRNGWGIKMNPESEEDIIRFGKIIEPLRMGSTAIPVPQNAHEDAEANSPRSRFTGDGPFDFVFERDNMGGLAFGMVTLRLAEIYASVIWEEGKVFTKKNVDSMGVGARMAQTVEPDKEIIFAAAVACLGMSFVEGGVMARQLSQFLGEQPSS